MSILVQSGNQQFGARVPVPGTASEDEFAGGGKLQEGVVGEDGAGAVDLEWGGCGVGGGDDGRAGGDARGEVRRLGGPGAGVGRLWIVALLCRQATQKWMSLAGQSSPLPAYWRTTIQKPVWPLARLPELLKRCQEVVSVSCVGPARHAAQALVAIAMSARRYTPSVIQIGFLPSRPSSARTSVWRAGPE